MLKFEEFINSDLFSDIANYGLIMVSGYVLAVVVNAL